MNDSSSLVPQFSAGSNVVDSVNVVNPVLKETKTEDICCHQLDMKYFNTFTVDQDAKINLRNIFLKDWDKNIKAVL